MLIDVGSTAFLPGIPGALRPSPGLPLSCCSQPCSQLCPTLEPVVISLNNVNNKPVRRFHSSHFIPQRGPREPEQLPQSCTAGTHPDQPELLSDRRSRAPTWNIWLQSSLCPASQASVSPSKGLNRLVCNSDLGRLCRLAGVSTSLGSAASCTCWLAPPLC